MGCTSSKQARRDRGRSPTPYDRSYSAPVNRRRNHIVSLTSTTLGSLKLDRSDAGASSSDEETMKSVNDAKAKAWSEMIERRFPKSPPCDQPEIINAWELMAGLDDTSSLSRSDPNRSFPASGRTSLGNSDPKTELIMPSHIVNSMSDSRTIFTEAKQNSDSIVSDFDPEVISSFQKALQQLSPQSSFKLSMFDDSDSNAQTPELTGKPNSPDSDSGARTPKFTRKLSSPYSDSAAQTPKFTRKLSSPDSDSAARTPKFTGIVKARVTAFQEKINSRRNSSICDETNIGRCPPDGERKVVLYFTSLRGIRKTYEDCWTVGVILRGYGVKVDERDVSMHAGFKEELKEAVGRYTLPLVFADGRYLGGAEEVRTMHEEGKLGEELEGCEMVMAGKGGVAGQCEGCGDMRFVPCERCSGSCKVYVEEEEGEEEWETDNGGGFRRCEDCNENGLVRCPICY